jgi:hypothetical protein
MRCVVVLLLAASSAAAEPGTDQAKAEAARANALATAGDFLGAAAKFRSAHALDAKPEYLCDVGVAYHRAKQLPRAQIYLAECLHYADSLEPKFVDLVRQAVADGETKLRAGEYAPVELTIAPKTATFSVSTFDADERFVGSQTLWLPFGHHTVDVRADGYEPQSRTIDVTARTPLGETIELHAVAAPPKRIPVQPPSLVTEEHTRSKVPALLASILTGGVGGIALGAYVHARSVARSAGSTTIDRAEYGRLADSAHSWQHASWALGGIAAAGAVVSTILWIRASQTYTIEVEPRAAGAAVSLTGSF